MARTSIIRELEDVSTDLWTVDRHRYATDDAVSQVLQRREFLTAKPEVSHAHMVGRDLAERGVTTTFDAPRPRQVGTEHAWYLLNHVLHEYAWHQSAFEDTIRWVGKQYEEADGSGLARLPRRCGSTLPAAAPTNPHHQPSQAMAARR